ncbi:regulatory particle non-ATPase [Thelotrema lepadinum]|nr:regulatory particle non-ATPase [Thelotrema lepadinum]
MGKLVLKMKNALRAIGRFSALPLIPNQALHRDRRRKVQNNEQLEDKAATLPTPSQSTESKSLSTHNICDNIPTPESEEVPPPAALPPTSLDKTSPSPSPTSTTPPAAMTTESSLRQTLTALQSASPSSPQTASLLKSAKHNLLALNALTPQPSTPPHLLALSRSTLEAGALLSIRAHDGDSFTRYYQQLQPFYELPPSSYTPTPSSSKSSKEPSTTVPGGPDGQRSKITGLHLMLLLTKGDYAGFHTVLEGLESSSNHSSSALSTTVKAGPSSSKTPDSKSDTDKFLTYPTTLEQWLMEGAYDRVWNATSKKNEAPSPEFAMFSEVLIHTIRAEIASCSEKAYRDVPVASAKNLLFLESEGAVLAFARERGWGVREGRVWFPEVVKNTGEGEGDGNGNGNGKGGGLGAREEGVMVSSGMVIENTIGYARELETIV